MGALTASRPKPLIPVCGRALIDRQLDLLEASGFAFPVINLHYRADEMDAHLTGRARVVREEPEILDTGGGLKAALPVLAADPVLTMTADAVWSGPNPVRTLCDAWDGTAGALLLIVPLGRTVGRLGGGDFALGEDGRLTRGGDHVFTGVQILRTGAVQDRPERVFSLNVVWDRLAAEGRLFGVEYPGRWADVGHPAGLEAAERMLADA